MAFLDTLFGGSAKQEFASRLHKKINNLLPDSSDEERFNIACISGLMARVAYADMKIHDNEKKRIESSLKKWTNLSQNHVMATTEIAISEVVDLAGLENTKYCHPLAEKIELNKRYELLVSLFGVAAADGSVEHAEVEEIRSIAKGLLLEHKHFISARATVLEKLKALK